MRNFFLCQTWFVNQILKTEICILILGYFISAGFSLNTAGSFRWDLQRGIGCILYPASLLGLGTLHGIHQDERHASR